MVPTIVVLRVGAMLLPVPLVGVVYHLREFPDAVKALTDWFWQYVIELEVTVGFDGIGLTVTVTWSVFEQLFESVPVTVYVAVVDGEKDTLLDTPPFQV